MIGGVIKYFRFSYDYVLWGISYINLRMLLATIPTYESPEDKEKSEKLEEVDGISDLEQFFKE